MQVKFEYDNFYDIVCCIVKEIKFIYHHHYFEIVLSYLLCPSTQTPSKIVLFGI